MMTVYLFSTLSHAIDEPNRRHLMRSWDQGVIYLLIAGTYSPFIWQGSSGGGRVVLLSAVWLAALLGFYLKVFSAYRVNAVSSISYVLLGWLPALPLLGSTPSVCLNWMIVGGLCYTVGIVFWVLSEHVRYSHAMWHIMVMFGTGSHFYAIFLLLKLAHTAEPLALGGGAGFHW
jgi:hemolysin III